MQGSGLSIFFQIAKLELAGVVWWLLHKLPKLDTAVRFRSSALVGQRNQSVCIPTSAR